jgi:predicted flap endonuclease-1-like 5' DNA nuclease
LRASVPVADDRRIGEEFDMRIEDVEGIGASFAEKLGGAGVRTTDDLLDRAGSSSGRERLAAATGISAGQLLKWANHVDLMRLDGVGAEFAELLEAAGVDSPAELAQRNAVNLAQPFDELDAARPNTVRRVPNEAVIAGWIAEAKTMARAVNH